MRRLLPVLLTGVIAASLGLPATASVPSKHSTTTIRDLTRQFDSQPSSLEDFRRQLLSPVLDPHPFSDEFYLRQFAAETPTESQRSHSRLAPLTNAASGLSKKVASLRRALARMMP